MLTSRVILMSSPRPSLWRVAWALLFVVGIPRSANAQVSAQVQLERGVQGVPIEIRVDTDGPPGLVDRVRVQLQSPGGVWTSTSAHRQSDGWLATLPAAFGPVQVRADLFGPRGGLILQLGYDRPLTFDLVSPSVALARRNALDAANLADEDRFVGRIGLDNQLGTGARLRFILGAGFDLAAGEVGLAVSVGPAFAVPEPLATGGPLVLGFSLAYRRYTQRPQRVRFAPFVEAVAGSDVRLPGADLGGGVRAGLAIRIAAGTTFELGLGGRVMFFNAVGSENGELGFAGGARVALAFDGPLQELAP